MPTADREGLREIVAEAFWNERYGSLPNASWESAVRTATAIPGGQAAEAVYANYRRASDFVDGPLSTLLAQADTVEQMEAERRARPNEVTVEMIAAAWEVVRDRYPQGRVLGPGPGFREAIAAALALRPLCDLEAQIVVAETEAEVDRGFAETSRRQADDLRTEVARLSAEVEALRAALALLLPFVDFAAGEGLMFEPTLNQVALPMDAADLCGAAAEALGIEIEGPEYDALLAAGHEAIRALTRTTDQPDPGTREGSV